MHKVSRVVGAAALLLLAGVRSGAEPLVGTIFMGPGLKLFLQKDESMFVQMLRAMALVHGEIPTVDLSALQLSHEDLFLGVDHGVYLVGKDPPAVCRVGHWVCPHVVQLDPDVELHVRYAVTQLFEGGTVPTLRVSLGAGTRAPVKEPERTGFEFWLAELGKAFFPGAMSKDQETDSAVMLNALLGAIPSDLRPTAEQGENLKRLERYVADRPFDSLAGVACLVKEASRRIRAQWVDQELSGDERSTGEYLVKLYDKLAATLKARE